MARWQLITALTAFSAFALCAQQSAYPPTSGGGGGSTIYTGSSDPNGDTAQFSPSNMTSDVLPSPYVASATVEYSGTYAAWKAFSSTYEGGSGGWLAPGAGGGLPPSEYLQIQLAAPFVLGSYSIVAYLDSGFGQIGPSSFTMAGSNDGTNFTTLDTRTSIGTYASGVAKTFTVSGAATNAAYSYYRLTTTATSAGSYVGVSSLKLISYAAPFTSGLLGDFYLQTNTKKLFGPRPAGTTPTWPLAGTLN